MTLGELNTVLNSTEIPTVYHSWSDTDSERPSLPFICYSVVYSNNFFADDRTYYAINHVQIELYTALKDLTKEAALEAALDSNDIPWEKTEVYLDTEHCYQIVYDIEI